MTNEEIELRYQQINIKRCLDLLFPDTFSSADLAAIAAAMIDLVALLAPQYKEFFDEHTFILSEAQKRMTGSASSLKTVLTNIKKDKSLGIHYLPAFLSCTLERTSYNEEKFEQYKALTFNAPSGC